MSEIKIKCPTCGKVLRLQDAPNINAASFTCPVCEEKHVVGKCQRYVEQPKPMVSSGDETRYGGASARQGDDETRIGSQPQCGGSDETRIGSVSSPAVGVLMDNMGRTYQLRLGINTIGRKAASSPASVQIATDDRTMSRSHAVIEVSHAGGKTIHILRNGANKNPSFLNGSLIGQQDQLILNNGDRIKMGNTEMTFKI
ncbi:FHA domain-containing protein [uncultured Prevotella sp.]|uniref:FHA domain-containing protein n=1 Tax=uncultured Prevotella sp. TaxID=159272 RepID=UPI00259988A9|nr:FHA domain-containing protein [uncultured Prevotella sp.]